MANRLIRYWVYGGFLAGFLVLGLMPLCCRGWGLPLVLVYLLMPVYMFHQLEEHDDDRFRQNVNRLMGGGREVLTQTAVFVINVPGVWGVNLLSILLASTVDLGFGLIGVYLMVLNGIMHIMQSIHLKQYNPGLVTSILLFLPVGGAALWAICATGTVRPVYHVLGFGSAIAIHAAIVAHVLIRRSRLPAPQG